MYLIHVIKKLDEKIARKIYKTFLENIRNLGKLKSLSYLLYHNIPYLTIACSNPTSNQHQISFLTQKTSINCFIR